MNKKQILKEVKQNKKVSKTKSNIFFVGLPLLIIFVILIILSFIRTSSVSGKIFSNDDNKIPLKEVKITLDDNKEIFTNKESVYKISYLKSGQHRLKFEKSGYEIFTQNIELVKGENFVFDAYLTEKKNIITTLSQNDTFIPITNTNKLFINNNLIDVTKNSLIINSNIYLSDNQNNYIIVLDLTGKEINKIQLPSESKPDKMLVSNLKDKLYVIFTNNNSIGIIDLNNNKFIEQSKSIDSIIIDIFIDKTDNRGLILSDMNISSFNILNNNIYSIKNNNEPILKSMFYKNTLFMINSQKALLKIDLYNTKNEPLKLNLSFTPEDIVVTKSDKIYISSGKNIYLIDSETGNTIKSFDIGININDIKVSPKDDNIYITDNSPNVYVFDTNKDELNIDKFTFKENIKEIFFSE